MKHYAGIGSRKTPLKVLSQMEKIASFLAERGFILRSGGAKGADTSFERGCDNARGIKQIWRGNQTYWPFPEWATHKASDVCWEYPLEKMKGGTIDLITRNMYQVFGDSKEYQTPVEFVVYWSPEEPLEKGSLGGTRYAVRSAHQAGIPTYNLRTQKEEFANLLSSLKKEK